MCQRLLKPKGLTESWKNAQILVLHSQYQNPKLYGKLKKQAKLRKILPFHLPLPFKTEQTIPSKWAQLFRKKPT